MASAREYVDGDTYLQGAFAPVDAEHDGVELALIEGELNLGARHETSAGQRLEEQVAQGRRQDAQVLAERAGTGMVITDAGMGGRSGRAIRILPVEVTRSIRARAGRSRFLAQ